MELEIVEYLKTPLDEVELKELLGKLGLNAHESFVPRKRCIPNSDSLGFNEEELLAAIIKYPILLERPIVVKGNQAVIGRPPENVKELF